MMLDNALISPVICDNIWSRFNWIYKQLDQWKVAGVTIPAKYILPYIPDRSYDELVALINSMRSNLVKAEKFMNQFGIGARKYDSKIVTDYSVKNTLDDDLIAFLSHVHYYIRSTSDRQVAPYHRLGGSATATHRWWFPKDGTPEVSELNALARLLALRDATYNVYGGLFAIHVPTTDTHVSVVRCKESESTEVLSSTLAGMWNTLKLFYATWSQTDVLNISTTGTYCGEVDISNESWPIAVDYDLRYYEKNQTLTKGILLRWIHSHMGFSSVNKDKSVVT
jgi:hypothetical protein